MDEVEDFASTFAVFKADPEIIDKLDRETIFWHPPKLPIPIPIAGGAKARDFPGHPQWFISMDKTGIRQKALDAIDTVS
ncbi:MAG: hypothetical protein R2874_01015 [Desulfobacterales bacterium]